MGGTNTKSIKEILDLSFSIGVQSDADLRFLEDKPETDDAGRLSLAQEAADYIKGSQAQNPFEGLSRQTLSAVAYERSGAWTTAERLSAFGQMNKLDGEYGNEVFFKTQSIDDYDVATVNLMTELKKIQGMSEAEKNEKLITKDSINAMQEKVEKSQADNKDKLLQYTPLEYQNLVKSDLTDLLVAKETGYGGYKWETGSSAQLFDSMIEKNEKINISSLVFLAG